LTIIHTAMLIYRFKIVSDDNDKFYREIEIKPGNSFEDFHQAIQDCVSFEKGEMASFYICDSKWNKLQEIALCDVSDPDATDNTEDIKVPEMSEVKLKDCINDPSQRMIYVYDFLKMHTLYIELSKITEGDSKIKYPRCIKCTSDFHKPLKNTLQPDELPDMENETPEDGEEFYNVEDMNFDDSNIIFGDSIDEKNYI